MEIQTTQWRRYALTALILLLIRIPFYLTHSIEEDAYITFRTAFHLADHGIFSFNLDSHTPGTTSVLYTLLIAVLRVIFGKLAIPAVQVFTTLTLIAGAFFASSSVASTEKQRYSLWVLASLTPIAFLTSYCCMEAPLLVLVIGLVMYFLGRPNSLGPLALCFFLLPLIRPEAFAISLLTLVAMPLLAKRRVLWPALAALGGVAALMVFNRLTSGSWAVKTAKAKEISYHPSFAIPDVFHRITGVLFTDCFLSPIGPQLTALIPPVFGVLSIGLCAYLLYRSRGDRERAVILGLAVALVFILPMSYAAGGVIFEWYLLPSIWLMGFLVVLFALEVLPLFGKNFRPVMIFAAVAVLFLADVRLYLTSVNIGSQEYHYRGDVGRFLGERSHQQGTLFLEPAGLIPFFSGIKTVDEVGLVADDVLSYRVRFPKDWWIRYVEEQKPTYIAQRGGFRTYTTFEGYTLTPEETVWFEQHYVKIGDFHYDRRAYFHNRFLIRLFAWGTQPVDFLVFELKPQSASNSSSLRN